MYDKSAIIRLKEYPIRDILRHAGKDDHGHRKGKRTFFFSPFRYEHKPSLCVFPDNTWRDFGDATGEYSGDAINLVEYIFNENFNMAVARLSEWMHIRPIETTEAVNVGMRKDTGRIIDIHTDIQSPEIGQYVASRCIPYNVFEVMAVELVYECYGRTHYAAAIPVDTGGYSIRGLPYPGNEKGIKRFLGGASGVSTLYSGTGNPYKGCLVFEGMFNAMSFVTMYGFPNEDIIILNGVGNAKILDGIGTTCGIKTLFCYLDADKAGNDAFERIRGSAQCAVYDYSGLYGSRGYNDLNEMLKALSIR